MTMLPPPSTYGLPERYSDWRPSQPDAVVAACNSSKQFTAIVAPTGFGKTITGATIAKFQSGRYAYLVETNNLISQIERDMPGIFFKIWGKRNYDCHLLLENGFRDWRAKCDQAESLCRSCQYKDSGCSYYDDVRKAARIESVLTNYSFWLSVNRYTETGIGSFDTLVLDEAHSILDALTKAMRVELSDRECERHLRERLPGRMELAEWSSWARKRLPAINLRVDGMKLANHESDRKEQHELERFAGKLGAVAGVGENWIEDRDWKEPDAKTAFEPVWPAPYNHLLFQPSGTKPPRRIVLMSATIRRKTMQLMGLEPDQYDFLEYPSSFPVDRRPVIYVPGANQRKTMTWEEKLAAVRKIDQIVERRLDRKGVIHTVSFDRAELLREYSKHAKRMQFTRRGRDLVDDLERFRRSGPGAVLVGPNFDEGVDLPYSDCEYQIIMKVPFPDTRSPVMKARCDSDPEYRNYLAMTSIVQMTGRGMRAADDLCETLIVDDQWGNWFLKQARDFAPLWFLQACRREQFVPKPPEKLPAGRAA